MWQDLGRKWSVQRGFRLKKNHISSPFGQISAQGSGTWNRLNYMCPFCLPSLYHWWLRWFVTVSGIRQQPKHATGRLLLGGKNCSLPREANFLGVGTWAQTNPFPPPNPHRWRCWQSLCHRDRCVNKKKRNPQNDPNNTPDIQWSGLEPHWPSALVWMTIWRQRGATQPLRCSLQTGSRGKIGSKEDAGCLWLSKKVLCGTYFAFDLMTNKVE